MDSYQCNETSAKALWRCSNFSKTKTVSGSISWWNCEAVSGSFSALDVIEPSVSPWSLPIVLVCKKVGSLRLCIDYRKLNEFTILDEFLIPNLTDSLFGLHGTKYFTSLDLVSGYHQIPLEDSRELTTFSTLRNHWQFKSLSFGMCNAPAAFQREIQAILSAFLSNRVIAYIDNILIMTKTFEEHIS